MADFVPYPDDAVVNESVDREGMSGSREEKVTYVAQSGGTVEFPEIILEWYNLETETVEKIVLAGRTFDVALKQGNRVQIDPQASRRVALYLMAMSALFWSVHRWCWPVLKPKIAALRSAYDKSVFAAHRQAVRAAVSRDLSGLMKALETLKSLGRAPSEPLNVAVRELTRAVYRDGKSGDATRRYWQEVHDMLRQDRPGVLPSLTRGGASLEPLNPFS